MRCGRLGGCAEAENNRTSLAFELPRKELPRVHLSARDQGSLLILRKSDLKFRPTMFKNRATSFVLKRFHFVVEKTYRDMFYLYKQFTIIAFPKDLKSALLHLQLLLGIERSTTEKPLILLFFTKS
ncbi:hypothetical protein TNIN_367851 [Trichonephila inaurata madagascariensis]|uniref:Uncharacterized protein n=1 Tax=Trichonephila inaurata madagascariensis TaxID=2747483 RepID=A0A8X6X4J8_9ARAC|nr:hypothetical protein TNIN_367851 [Trichonephila inaurata madagascariensis]